MPYRGIAYKKTDVICRRTGGENSKKNVTFAHRT